MTAATIASPIPVFPLVGSTSVEPGRSVPFFSASSIIERAIRSLTLPPGFCDSTLARTVALPEGGRRFSRTSAVLPIAEARARFAPKETVARPDAALIPGLVNAHTHNPMTLLRGVADDLPLMEWLQGHIWPIEGAVVGPDFIEDGVTLAIAEMIRGGTTCCNENYFFPDVQAATYRRHGFRARVGLPVIDFPTAWARTNCRTSARSPCSGSHSTPLSGWGLSGVSCSAEYAAGSAYVTLRRLVPSTASSGWVRRASSTIASGSARLS